MKMENTAYIILENGKIFTGKRIGAKKDVIAELSFTTGVVGYLETLTDKSAYGAAIVQTFPIIGNYGVIPEDFEGKDITVSAYIVRELCETPSNFRCKGTLSALLEERGIPGIKGIDTRALTKMIREQGTMNMMLCSELPKDMEATLKKIKEYKLTGAVSAVSVKEKYVASAEGEKKFSVSLIDFGARKSLVSELTKRGCEVTVYPYNVTAEEIISAKPDGIVLSNGPGDPTENPEVIKMLEALKEKKIPTFGVCIGHQLFALANGFTSKKLEYGHHGGNQPVRRLADGRIYITSQSHGYAVECDKADPKIKTLWINENDKTVEGIEYSELPAFTVQFHPEACAGPLDTNFLFDKFIDLMK